jgi:hypothetical protein
VIELLKSLIKSPDASKSAGERDLDHREIGLMNQLLGEQHAAGLRNCDRGLPGVIVR